jgi:hypothetical protein
MQQLPIFNVFDDEVDFSKRQKLKLLILYFAIFATI